MLGFGIRRKSQIVYSKPWWWWDPWGQDLCVWGAYRAVNVSSFADSLVDLSGNGHDLGDPGGANTPDWSGPAGWQFTTANSQYLTTDFVAENDQSQTVAVRFSNAIQVAHYLCGASSAGGIFGVAPSTDPVQDFVAYLNGQQSLAAGHMAAGNLAIAGDQGYRDGVADGAAIGSWTGASTEALWIGGLNDGGGGSAFLTGYIQALVIFDCVVPPDNLFDIVEWMSEL